MNKEQMRKWEKISKMVDLKNDSSINHLQKKINLNIKIKIC